MRNIDPFLLSKLKNNNQTIYENANPKMSIQVARAKSTVMDSTYWTVEKIREKEGLGDLSIATRRFKAYGKPNRLYNIYVDNGTVKTATREYPDYQKNKWQNQFELGPGKAVAIAFNGKWERYRDYWGLATDENPYLFWVDDTGNLYTQIWDDISTKFQLSTNVNKVKAIRGWKNVNFKDKDHGIIAAYIKNDGKVYYRNYCTQLDNTVVWENEIEVTEFTGTAVNINLFLTNDYRTGFIIEDSLGKIHWIITARNWAGMAIAPDKFNVSASASIDFIETNKIRSWNNEKFNCTANANVNFLFGSTHNEIKEVKNIDNGEGDWGFVIRFEILNKSETDPVITLTDIVKGTNIEYTSITEISPNVYDIAISNIVESGINNVEGDIKISITGLVNEAGYNYINLEQVFTPINLVPTAIPLPEVEAIWNE